MRKRGTFIGTSVVAAALTVLTGVPGAMAGVDPVTIAAVQGNGMVTVSWTNNDSPEKYVAEVLEIRDPACTTTLYSVAITPPASGSQVITTSSPEALAPGEYGFQVGGVMTTVGGITAFGSECVTAVLEPPTVAASLPSWWQSVGRASAEERCPAGWGPSWAQWMHKGTGGYVCNREIYWNASQGVWLDR